MNKLIRLIGITLAALPAIHSRAIANEAPTKAESPQPDKESAKLDATIKELKANTKSSVEPAGDGTACTNIGGG
jgi:hypothetical protein